LRKRSKKTNVGSLLGYPLVVVFDGTTGDFQWLNSATGAYWGRYDSSLDYTVIQYAQDSWYPSSGQHFFMHRIGTFFDYARYESKEIDWDTSTYHYMTVVGVYEETSPLSKNSSSSSSSSSALTRKPAQHFSNGRFRKPISDRAWNKRVGDDYPCNVAGVFLITSPYTHVMSTPNMLFDVDNERYRILSSPVAFANTDNFCLVEIESYSEFYMWTVQTTSACSIGNTANFVLTSIINDPAEFLRSSYPLGRQLQASIPDEVIHHGVSCSGCSKPSITGIRYQCCECINFDLCSKCENAMVERPGHSADHHLLKIKVPVVARTVHTGVSCDKCGVLPIEGIRYKCQICENFDMCEKCERTTEHPANHPLIKAKLPLK